MSNWDVMKWEAGERTRPLTKEEFREQLEETIAQWVDAHEGLDSGDPDAQCVISDIGDEFEERADELLAL